MQRLNEGSGNVDPHGNFSIQVLRSALQNQFGLELPNLRQEGISSQEPTTMEGFICNKQSHWFAIRKINGRYWNLNSTADRPVVISHFNVATELDTLIKDGYSVFCVANEETTKSSSSNKEDNNNNKRKQPQHLPPACTSVQEMERRKDRQQLHVKGNWWRESDLLKSIGAATATKGSVGGDPWKNVGSGMRLDGAATAASKQQQPPQDWANGLTEEEQLQMAVAMSMETPTATTTKPPTTTIIEQVTVPPEPAAGTPGAVRIQFRLPSNPRVVRRFMTTDTVAVVMSFCAETENGDIHNLDLRYGFPPKDLKPLANQTIAEAKLAGESIQGRRI